jgi:hypothetical protein
MSTTKPLKNTMRKSPMKQTAYAEPATPSVTPTKTYAGTKPTVAKKKEGEVRPPRTTVTKAEALANARSGKTAKRVTKIGSTKKQMKA